MFNANVLCYQLFITSPRDKMNDDRRPININSNCLTKAIFDPTGNCKG